MLSVSIFLSHLCNQRLPIAASASASDAHKVRQDDDALGRAPTFPHDGPACWLSALLLPGVTPGYLLEGDASYPSPSLSRHSHKAPFFSCLHALAVHDGSTRITMSTIQHSQLGTESVVELLPHSSVAPCSEVLVDCLPGRKVMRQHAPGATSSEQVEYGIGYLSQLVLAFATC